MWSPGLLFLLLVSSCLPVLSTPPGTSLEEEQLNQELHGNQHRNMFKKIGGWLKKNFRWVGQVLATNVALVPVAGPPIAGQINTLLLLAPQADPLDIVNSELKALHVKLDTFGVEMKWDARAAGAYQMPVNNIEKAWFKYIELVRSYQQTTNTEKEALKKNFFTFYSQYADSTLVLHQFLTAKSVSITQNLGDLLADRLRCHEKDIKAQFLYLNELMCKGNVLNEKYYEFKGTSTNAWVNTAHKIASQSASALITSHKRCISDSAAYIEQDIFERIDYTKKHQEIADSVRAFLAKTYDRYDWMVVAFTTQNSKHKPKLLKRHALSGFTEVERGTVTVAVAKQVKGGHTMAAAVKEAIKKCLRGLKICLDVAQKLMECQEKVFGKRLSQTYTAVHSFKKNSQTSTSAVEAPDDEDSALPESSVSLKDQSLTPHIFTEKCGRFYGKFIIFIKSDEEMMVDPSDPSHLLCTKVNCGQNGKCVVVSGTFIALCECQYPYYGERCEMSLESYKRQLQRDAESRTQTPESNNRRRSNNRSSRQSTPRRSNNHSSRQSTPRPSNSRSSRQSTPRRSNSRSSRQSTSRRSNSRSSRQSTPRRSNSRSSRQSTPRRSNNRSSRQSTPRRSNSRSSRQSTPRRSADRRSQQLAQSRPINRRPSQQAQRRATPGRLNSGSGQGTPGSSAKGQDSVKSFCGSLTKPLQPC